MVHWQNIPYILANGICCREHPNADPDYINIGHRQLIDDRHNYSGGLPDGSKLGEYVPFYFGGHSPMLYLIMKGFQGVTKLPQEDIVFIAVKYQEVVEGGLPFVFTDRNAKIAVAKFYRNPADLEKLKWDIIESKEWRNTEEDFQRQDFKQAEFLIRHEVPVEFIHTLVVKTEVKKINIEEAVVQAGLEIPVKVAKPGRLYY